jgi:hypothetical protein
MGDFCSDNKETITNANYTATFKGTSCLPMGGQGFAKSSIATNGTIDSTLLKNHVKALLDREVEIETGKAKASAPRTIQQLKEMNPAEDFSKASAKLRDNIHKEYCFYYKRYIFILREILMQAATQEASQLGAAYQTKKTNTEALNSKLNQILQIIQAIVNIRMESLKDYYGKDTGVNQTNKYLDDTRGDLINHSKLLKNLAMEKDLKSAMVDYTVEKNSSSRNLLAIYGFMNIVAAGLIFYLYRTAKN